MVRYPLLSLAQQQDLPRLTHAEPLPAMFEDSTHQLWQCETAEGEMMLKVCNVENVRNSTFWQGMSLLFDVQLPAQLGEFKHVYDLVSQNTSLTIPDYVASDSEKRNKQQRAFILTKMMPGIMVEPEDVDDAVVIALAKHLSQLHTQQQITWGRATESTLAMDGWPERLQSTLTAMALQQNIPEAALAEALVQAKTIKADFAVPIMLDLRWDQFLQENGKLSALVDLDAIVYAPKELELVLLEYLLNDEQVKLFATHYQQTLTFPDLKLVRKPYRLLLFMMNVLGETELDVWMEAKHP